MVSARSIQFVCGSVLLLMASACAEVSTSEPESQSNTPEFSVADGGQAQGPGERHFERLSRSDGSFAGFWYDEMGNLHVSMTSAVPSARIRMIADSLWLAHAKYFTQSPRGAVFYDPVKHSYSALARARQLIRSRAFGQPGVRSIDLDEVRNMVVIGVDPAARQTVAGAMAEFAEDAQVPNDAFEVVDAGSYLPDQGVQADSLRGLQRPLQAGYLTAYRDYRKNKWYGCTIGWVTSMDPGDVPVFVTASHCSTFDGFQDSTRYAQPNDSTALVGSEYLEAPWFECRLEVLYIPCTYGDVNVVRIDTLDVPWAMIGFNQVGRPDDDASIYIDQSQPKYDIIGEVAESFVGLTFYKIGQVTGRSSGWVRKTCVDMLYNEVGKLCLDQAAGGADTGDSGGPYINIYSATNSTAFMVGVHSGRAFHAPTGAVDILFTPMRIIHWNFPDIEALAQ